MFCDDIVKFFIVVLHVLPEIVKVNDALASVVPSLTIQLGFFFGLLLKPIHPVSGSYGVVGR
jgi:hypothetical protein